MNTLDEILTRLENSVERDIVLRQVGQTQRQGRSPKSIHAEAKAEIIKAIEKIIGEDEFVGLPTTQEQEQNNYNKKVRNTLRTDMRQAIKEWSES